MATHDLTDHQPECQQHDAMSTEPAPQAAGIACNHVDSASVPFPFPRDLAVEPSAELTRIRQTTGVSLVELPSGHHAWLVAGYDDVRSALSDPRLSCAAASQPGAPEFVPFVKLCKSLFSLDPPVHTRVRSLLTSGPSAN